MASKTLLAGLALALLASTASAQTGRVVSFGDSLSDTGNLFAFTGRPPAPYAGGRFSNGPVWIEQGFGPFAGFTPLPPSPNGGNVNYAFGGARTDNANPGGTPIPLGLPAQIATFAGTGGRFAPGDLAAVWVGANNVFQAIEAPGATQASIGAAAATAATDVARSVAGLAPLGARTVAVLNLPDLGRTPSFIALGGTAQGAATFGTAVFNGTLAGALPAAAATGLNVVQVDVFSTFQAVTANPGAFGFTNVTQACIQVPSCVAGGPAVQNGFLFWDGVHPTTAGHRLVAQVVDQYLNAGAYAAGFAAYADLALDERRSGLLRAFDRLETRAGIPGLPGEGTVSIIGGSTRVDAEAGRPGYRFDQAGLALGLTRALGQAWTMGLQASASTGDGRVGGFETQPTALNADAVAAYAAGPFFVKAGLGAGVVSFSEVERRTLGPLVNRSDTTAITGSAAIEAGLAYGLGGVTLSPRGRLAWIGAEVEGFQETGTIAPLALESRQVSTIAGALELRASVDVVRSGARVVTAFGTIGYEAYFARSGDDLSGRLLNNTALPFATALDDPRSPGLTVGAGLQGTLTREIALGVEYRGAFGEGGSQRHQAMGSLSYRF